MKRILQITYVILYHHFEEHILLTKSELYFFFFLYIFLLVLYDQDLLWAFYFKLVIYKIYHISVT